LPAIAPAQARLEQTMRGLDGPGLALAISEGAAMVAAACDQGTIQLWHKDTLLGLRDGSDSVNVLNGHTGPVLDLAWNGGKALASVGADKKLFLWDALEGKLLHSLEAGHLVRALALSPDGKILAGVGDSANVQLWDAETGKPTKELKGHTDWLHCLSFSADGKQMVTGGYEGRALLWDLGSGTKVRDLPAPPKDKPKDPPPIVPVTAVSISPDGKQVLLGLADGNIDQVNLADGKTIRTLKGHASAATGLLYHPSGTPIISCSKDGSVRLWNPADGALIKALTDHTAWVEDIALLAEGTRLVSVGADQTVRVWNLTAP
jgi:WD40 repeat protein